MRANRREPGSVPFWFQSKKGRPHGGLLQQFISRSAADAQQRSGIDLQARRRDIFTAALAITVIIFFNTPQGSVDLQQCLSPPPPRLFRHRLRLHGIHARQAAHPCLVQFNGLLRLVAGFLRLEQGLLQIQENFSVIFHT